MQGSRAKSSRTSACGESPAWSLTSKIVRRSPCMAGRPAPVPLKRSWPAFARRCSTAQLTQHSLPSTPPHLPPPSTPPHLPPPSTPPHLPPLSTPPHKESKCPFHRLIKCKTQKIKNGGTKVYWMCKESKCPVKATVQSSPGNDDMDKLDMVVRLVGEHSHDEVREKNMGMIPVASSTPPHLPPSSTPPHLPPPSTPSHLRTSLLPPPPSTTTPAMGSSP